MALTSFNWRPITYAAFVLASKFWEDVNIWNIDYAESLGIYSLVSTMKLESAFLGICKYNMFVNADLYAKYFFAIRRQSRQSDLFASINIHADAELKASLIQYTQGDSQNKEPNQP